MEFAQDCTKSHFEMSYFFFCRIRLLVINSLAKQTFPFFGYQICRNRMVIPLECRIRLIFGGLRFLKVVLRKRP